ncbi:MAG: hypothetical protein IKG27_01265 [Bacilli bacterium]|nr:hypothetical protein [Bacilli bacterium]
MDEKEVSGIKVWQIILILIIIFSTMLTILFINRPKKVIKKDVNINYEDQIINNLNFEKIKIYSKNNKYYFIARVKNNNNYDIDITPITVKLMGDKDITFTSYIGDKIKIKDYKLITMETKEDLSKIKTTEFSFNK